MSKSRTLKKNITMILTLLILIASVPSYGAKVTFSDIKGHWANKYIEDMAGRGYLNGFPGGTFGPEGNLTLMQAISTLSRFVDPTDTEKSNAKNGYNFLFNELKIEQDWEREGLAVALFKNIITEKEVRDAIKGNMLNKSVNREKTSELLAKAMGLEGLANSIDVVYVEYKDISKVDPAKRKYLRVLLDAGILDPKGKGNNDFQPKANLTRAEMSKLLSEGVDYLKKDTSKPESVEYEYITDKIKRITVDAGTFLVFEDKSNKEEAYRIEASTSITIDGKKSSVSSLEVGQEVKLKIKKGTTNIVSVETLSAEESLSGVAKYVFASNDKITLEYKDDKKVLTKDYYVDSNAKIYINDKSSSLKDLKDGDLVKLKIKNNKIVDIEANSKAKKATGIIKEITPMKDGKITSYLITIEDKDGASHKYLTDGRTDFYRKDKTVAGEDIKLKDEAYIDGEYNLEDNNFIAKIVDANVFKRKIKGQVTETVKRVNKNTLLTIENRETKKEESYDLASNVEIIIDGKKASSLPSDPGYYAELELENDEIVEIYIDTKRAEESIVGRIIDMNYREGIIYVEDNSINYDPLDKNDFITIYTTDKTLFRSENLTKASFDDLRIGEIVMVAGVYKGKNFEANLIVIR